MAARRICRVCERPLYRAEMATETVCKGCFAANRMQPGDPLSHRIALMKDHKRQRRIQVYRARAVRGLPLFV